MSGVRLLRRRAARAAALLTAFAVALGGVFLSPAPLAAHAATLVRAAQVRVSILSISPSTPAITPTARPLTITASLLNTTGAALTGVTLSAERGDPITTQAALTTSLASAAARTGGKAITAVKAATVNLPPGIAVTATYTTTTSREDAGRICLCANAVYPIDLSAQATVDGATQTLGGTRTYLPSFEQAPGHRIGVTWVWPLIDRPHRTTDAGRVFTDDDLAASVDGGRLDRALQVVEGVTTTDPSIPLTLVVDPDLIDELQVMSLGSYTVRAADGTVTAGSGSQAASAWLARLRTVLSTQTNVDVEFTPPADPDVTGLSRHHLSWSTNLSAAAEARVTTALGRSPTHGLAWPPGNTATLGVLGTAVANGVDTVLLDGAQVRPNTAAGMPIAATRVRTSRGSIAALLTSPTLQRYAAAALTGTAAAVPDLLAELAVRVTERPDPQQQAVLTAPRYVDPANPALAIRAVVASSSSVFSTPVSVPSADATVPASARPAAVRTGTANLSPGQLDRISTLTGYRRAVSTLIDGSAAGRLVVAALPGEVQRTESAAWTRTGASAGIGGGPTAGDLRTSMLTAELTGYLGKVRILKPSSGSYTLASNDSPLPISVRNDSPLTYSVRVAVHTVGGLPGFSARDVGTVRVAGNSTATIKVPTRIQRGGRIPVEAELRTPDDYALGTSVRLFVRSTVLGTIGVVITVCAGVILVLALLVRYVRRVLRLRSKRGAPRGRPASSTPPQAEHEPVP